MKITSHFFLIFALSLMSFTGHAKSKKQTVRKVQEVNFSEMSLKGTIRNPEGAYLVQKKGLRFKPLHDVQKDLDQKIRESSVYVR